MQPNIVNLSKVDNIKEWIQEGSGNNIYIARETRHHTRSTWCNPYRLKDHGYNREIVLDLFLNYFIQNKELIQCLPDLKGKILGCWCAPNRCHGEILHIMAGNVPVYENQAMDDDSPMTDPLQLHEKVTQALQVMNDFLENDEHKELISSEGCGDPHLPFPTVDVATPTLRSLSTTESTNTVYESLLESNTSPGSSSRKTLSSESTSTSSSSQINLASKISETGANWRELIANWREKLSKSFSSSSSPSPSSKIKRQTYSAPASPVKRNPPSSGIERQVHSAPPSPSRREGVTLPLADFTVRDPPRPFYYDSRPTPNATLFVELVDQPVTDATRNILAFLANKVDVLAVGINTIQYNLSKLAETFHISLEEKSQENDVKMELAIDNKFVYLENKIDSNSHKIKVVEKENQELRDKLAAYISQEAEREDLIKECFNNSHPAFSDDLASLKEDLERKIIDLDTRLASSPRPNRLPSFSDECRDAPDGPVGESDEEVVTDESMNSINSNFDQFTQLVKEWDDRIMDLDVRLLECEQYTRRECVVISGIPENIKGPGELEATVLRILQSLKIYIAGYDISAVHRLGFSKDPRYPSRVIVKFINRKIANLCFERKEWLPDLRNSLGMNIRFHESLAQLNQESLRLCTWLKSNGQIHDHFSRNGYCKIVATANDKPVKVPHPEFLRVRFGIPERVK